MNKSFGFPTVLTHKNPEAVFLKRYLKGMRDLSKKEIEKRYRMAVSKLKLK